jgi:2-keto-4-pentenoate hydratase
VSGHKNQQLILGGIGADAMGDQWLALQWLINQTLANGWEINPDHLLITGAIGKMLAADPGHYRIDYGPLGIIEFTMTPIE